MIRRFGLGAIVLSIVSTPSTATFAADISTATSDYWTVVIGAEGRIMPRWQGADGNYIFLPTPYLDIRRAGTPEHFHGPRDGFGIAFIDTEVFRVGPAGKIRLPRRESADSKLAGLGNVDTAYEFGVFAEYLGVHWLRIRSEVWQGFGGHKGLMADLMADLIARVTPRLTLSTGPRITFANTPATTPYFSITTAQSATSGLPVFDAKGGVRSVGAGAQARYYWTPQWATHVFVEYERLSGDAKNSPLVSLRGSPDQWTFGFGVTYAFNLRAWW